MGITDGLTQLLVSRGIGLGYYHACHILENKKVKCFGTADPRNRPPADVMAAEVDQINCAHNGCCALMPAGSGKKLSCWSHKQTFYPPNGGNDLDPIHFGIGYDHACAVNKDNTVKCWGNGPGKGPQLTAPADLRAKSIAVATFYNCVIKMDDSVYCWGTKAPQPPEGLKAKLVAAIYHGNTRADNDDITQGTGHACAIKLDDTLVCWGDNIEGTTDVPAEPGQGARRGRGQLEHLRGQAGRRAGLLGHQALQLQPRTPAPPAQGAEAEEHPRQAGHLLRPADGQHHGLLGGRVQRPHHDPRWHEVLHDALIMGARRRRSVEGPDLHSPGCAG